MKSILIFLLSIFLLSVLFLISNANAADITLSQTIAGGYHIADNGGNITILDNSEVENESFVICVAEGTTTIGTGFRVETGGVFYVSSGTTSEISEVIDYDNDLLPDFWEFKNFTNLESQDASGDYDEDGSVNITEYEYGTEPDDSSDKPPTGIDYEYDEYGRIKKIIRNK